MKTVVHRGARTLAIESRATEAPGIATDDTEALRANPRRDRAIRGRIPAGRPRHADDLTGAEALPASPAPDRADGGRPGR